MFCSCIVIYPKTKVYSLIKIACFSLDKSDIYILVLSIYFQLLEKYWCHKFSINTVYGEL